MKELSTTKRFGKQFKVRIRTIRKPARNQQIGLLIESSFEGDGCGVLSLYRNSVISDNISNHHSKNGLWRFVTLSK